MKKILLVTVGLAAFSLVTPASAADLAARPYTKAPPMVSAAIYDWSGFYIGANAGYGWGRDNHADLTPLGGAFTNGPTGNFGGVQRIKPAGGIFGGQAGYNWQMASWVFGVELSGDWADLHSYDQSIFFAGEGLTSKIDGMYTGTGRVGYAFNNILPYIKGGYAAAKLQTSNFDNLGTSLNHSQWRSGYTIGAGIEYGITPNWTIGAEYAYMDFGKSTWTGVSVGPIGTAERFNDSLKISTVTARINYKFGGWGASRY